MKKISLLLLVLFFLGLGCSRIVPEKMSDDFSFTYYFGGESLPSSYYYEYTLTVNQDGKSKIRYIPGHEDVTSSSANLQIWEEEFNFSTEDRLKLFDWMKGNGVFDKQEKIQKEKIAGSDYYSLKVKNGSKDYNLSYSGTDPKLLELFEKIEHLVPEEIWVKIGQKAQGQINL